MRGTFRLIKTTYSPTNRRLSTVLLSCLATFHLFLAPLAIITTATVPTFAETPSAVPTVTIFDNGGLATGANANNGVAAPAGTQWSETPNPYGNTQQANTLAGVSCSVTATLFRCADDFSVPPGQTWTIDQVIVFAYQTGFTGTVSPINQATLRIWNGRPGDAGATIIFGDTTTNRLATSVDSGLWRIFSSVVGVGAQAPTAPITNRRIWRTAINVIPAQVLTAGTYWIDWNTRIGTTTAHFAPNVSYPGVRGVPGWNSRQFTGAAWQNVVDNGQAPTGAPVPAPWRQDFPFKLEGSVSGAPLAAASRRMDFSGDNKSDYVVARSASLATQTTWHMLDSTGAITSTLWGLGVGFAGGDVATPEDFDGDGRTDIAVWRGNPGDPNASNFYILQSSTGTLRTEQFGRSGDDATVVDDYDGDGKADVAVYRSSTGPDNPCGGSTVWFWRPSATPATNFSYACWGSPGDKAFPGDFDGDGRADFSIVRDNAGVGVVWQSRTTAGPRTLSYGNFTDKYISGDFDGDGKMDLAVVRVTGTTLTWYFDRSGTGESFAFTFGNAATDFVVPGDYDGDNRTDFALWRSGSGADNGFFYFLKTFSSPIPVKFGQSAVNLTAPDFPVAAYQAH